MVAACERLILNIATSLNRRHSETACSTGISNRKPLLSLSDKETIMAATISRTPPPSPQNVVEKKRAKPGMLKRFFSRFDINELTLSEPPQTRQQKLMRSKTADAIKLKGEFVIKHERQSSVTSARPVSSNPTTANTHQTVLSQAHTPNNNNTVHAANSRHFNWQNSTGSQTLSPSNSTGSQTGSPGSALGSPAREPIIIAPGRASGQPSSASAGDGDNSRRGPPSGQGSDGGRPRTGSDAGRNSFEQPRSRQGSDSGQNVGESSRSRIASDPSCITDDSWRADEFLTRHRHQRTPHRGYEDDDYDVNPAYFKHYRCEELDEFSLCYCGGEIEDDVCLKCSRSHGNLQDTSERSNDPLSSSADLVTRAGQTEQRTSGYQSSRSGSAVDTDKDRKPLTSQECRDVNNIAIYVPCSTSSHHSKTTPVTNPSTYNPTKPNTKLTKVNSSGNIRSPTRETSSKTIAKTPATTRQSTATPRTSQLLTPRPTTTTSTSNSSKKSSQDSRTRCRRSSARARLRRSTFTRSPSDLSTESGSTSGGGGCSTTGAADGGLEYPCTPELLLEAHKRKHLLDPTEEWMVLELNEYECLIDNIQIVKAMAKHSRFFEVEPPELVDEFFLYVDVMPSYDEVINYDTWQEFRDKKYLC